MRARRKEQERHEHFERADVPPPSGPRPAFFALRTLADHLHSSSAVVVPDCHLLACKPMDGEEEPLVKQVSPNCRSVLHAGLRVQGGPPYAGKRLGLVYPVLTVGQPDRLLRWSLSFRP